MNKRPAKLPIPLLIGSVPLALFAIGIGAAIWLHVNPPAVLLPPGGVHPLLATEHSTREGWLELLRHLSLHVAAIGAEILLAYTLVELWWEREKQRRREKAEAETREKLKIALEVPLSNMRDLVVDIRDDLIVLFGGDSQYESFFRGYYAGRPLGNPTSVSVAALYRRRAGVAGYERRLRVIRQALTRSMPLFHELGPTVVCLVFRIVTAVREIPERSPVDRTGNSRLTCWHFLDAYRYMMELLDSMRD